MQLFANTNYCCANVIERDFTVDDQNIQQHSEKCLFEKVEFFVAGVDSVWTPFAMSSTFGANIATHWYQCKVIAKCVFQRPKRMKLSERDG